MFKTQIDSAHVLCTFRSSMARTPSLATLHGTATRATSLYDALRSDLLGGVLEPGMKLAMKP